MSLTQLNIHHLRNISESRLPLNPRFNLFVGENGSGKTSLLEAIYLLSCGHSFRTREISPLIALGELALTVFARTDFEDSISIQKSNTGPTQVKINNQFCHSSSELALFLPCQIFYQDIFQIIDAGPSVRRSLMDWGLFHVKQSYHSLWKDYRRVLKQRNALLRQKATQQACAPWDKMLVDLSIELDLLRHDFFAEWSDIFQMYLQQLTDTPCSISYYKGWDRKGTQKSLAIILSDHFAADSQRQYTQYGAHQADIIFDSEQLKAKQSLSRGQQKIILIALKLAQAHLLSKECIYLFDDVVAELDMAHQRRLIHCLTQIKGQFFFTMTDIEQVARFKQLGEFSVFGVDRGEITQVS